MSQPLNPSEIIAGQATPFSLAAHSDRQWFALYTAPRHEKRVSEHLQTKGLEQYLPLYSSSRSWKNGLKVQVEVPLFPGYVFVRIARSERVAALEVPGAVSFVTGADKKPAPLSDSEIEILRTGLSLRRAEPHRFLRIGQRARIRSGALAGMEGIVVRTKGSLRIVLTMNLIMRSISVEVDSSELESLDPESFLLPANSYS